MGVCEATDELLCCCDLTPKIPWFSIFTFIMILCNISAHQKDFSFRLQKASMRFCDLYNALVMLTFKARNSYEMFRVLLMVAYSSAFKTSSISVLRTFQPIWKIRYYFVSFHFPNSASSFSATESPFETMCFKIATISELYQLSSERKSRDGLCVDNDL